MNKPLMKSVILTENSTIYSATSFTPYNLLIGHTDRSQIFDHDDQLHI